MSLLITLLIFSLPLGVISRIAIIPNVYIYSHDIIAFLIMVLLIRDLILKKIVIDKNKIFIGFSLFLFACILSLVVNFYWLRTQEIIVAFLYLFRYFMYASIIFSVSIQSKKFISEINSRLIIAGAFFILFGLFQYTFYQSLKNLFSLGWDDHLYRLFSTFLDPNFAGIFLVLIFLLFAGNLLVEYKKRDMRATFVFAFFSILSLVSILLTYSRSAFVALIIGAIVLILSKKKSLVIPSVLVLFLAFFLFSNTKVEGLNPFRFVSSEARVLSIKDATAIVFHNPILGVGFNTYRYAQIKYGYRYEITRFRSNADAGTDNSYLFVLATTGLLGFGAFSYFLFTIVKNLIPKKSDVDVLSNIALPSFAAVAASSLFINSLFYPLIIAWIFILIGVTVSKKQ